MQRPVVGRVNDEAMKEGFLLDLHLVCGAPRLALRLVWPDFFFFLSRLSIYYFGDCRTMLRIPCSAPKIQV